LDWLSYEEELETVWGKRWGAQSEIGKLEEAFVLRPGAESSPPQKELSWYVYRRQVDITLMQEQHDRLVDVVKGEGVKVHYSQVAQERLMKNPYGFQLTRAAGCRDPGVVINGGAIIGRMAVPFRRGEEVLWSKKVMELGCPILYTVRGHGTFEGGNVVWLDPHHVCVGIGVRTNREGIEQISPVLTRAGVEDIRLVPLPYTISDLEWPAGGWPHLDCVFGMADIDVGLIYPPAVGYDFIQYLREKNIRLVEVRPDEARGNACNIVAMEAGKVVMNSAGPKARKLLEKEGIEVIVVEMGEFAVRGGGPHCMLGCLVRQPGPTLEG
jgi:N-dimethylarginine dimethylaminohydrolase